MKKILFQTDASFDENEETVNENPFLGKLMFVLTDAEPNKNKQGIPQDSFPLLINSGKLMPIKIAEGQEQLDHENAIPVGPIFDLNIDENRIVGQAAIWKTEHSEAYNMLKQMFENGEPINISWEICYSEASVDDDGIEWIQDPILRAATIVNRPAYDGRTPVIAVASEIAQQDADGSTENELSKEEILEKISTLEDEIAKMRKELEELRMYKAMREKIDIEEAKYNERLKEISEAGVQFSDEELSEYRATWISMSDEDFKNMILILKKAMKTSQSSVTIPDVTPQQKSIIEVVRQGLLEMKSKEKK